MCFGSVHLTNLSTTSNFPSTVTSSFRHYSVAGRPQYPSCILLYLLHCFCRASSMVSLSPAFVIIGLTHIAFVRTRSIHTLVSPRLDLKATSLPLPPGSLDPQISPLHVLGALSSGRFRCSPAKTPLAPRNRTWIRDQHHSRLASPQLRQRFSLQTRIILRLYSLRRLAVCSSLHWSRILATIEPFIIIELVSDAENDGVAFCTLNDSGYPCKNKMPDGFITAAAVASANDNSWIQVAFAHLSRRVISTSIGIALGHWLYRLDKVSLESQRRRWTIRRALPERGSVYLRRVGSKFY